MILFEPLQIGSMRLENRIVLPAMVTRLCGEDGFVNRDIIDRYVRYAQGEPGMIVVEAMGVRSVKSGQLLRLSEDRFIEGHRALLQQMRAASRVPRIAPQIIDFLKISRSGWRQKVADLTKEEIATIIAAYAAAGKRARECGYDGVELHMAHAYTMSSFLSQHNRRKDEYGGTLENRLRAPSEAIAAVRAAVGRDFPIGIRFDGEECITDGYGLNDAREIALRFARLGVDWISISAGGKFEDAIQKPGQAVYPYTGYSGDRCMPSTVYQDGYNLYLAGGIRAHLQASGFKTPIVATGKIRTREIAERTLTDGTADLVGMARTLLADPDWPRKVRVGQDDRVVRCLSINVCKALDENFKKVRCYLWPKGALHAPISGDTQAPQWKAGALLRVVEEPAGHVRLTWDAAMDAELYGYEVWRSTGSGAWEFAWSTRADMHTTWQDLGATAGVALRYRVRAYDVAGNKSEPSNEVEIKLALPGVRS